MLNALWGLVKGFPGSTGIIFAAGVASGAAGLYFTPVVGMRDTVNRLAPQEAIADRLEEKVDETEGLRSAETNICRVAVADERARWQTALSRCQAELAVPSIQPEVPEYDENMCPQRRLLPTRELLGSVSGLGRTGDGSPRD